MSERKIMQTALLFSFFSLLRGGKQESVQFYSSKNKTKKGKYKVYFKLCKTHLITQMKINVFIVNMRYFYIKYNANIWFSVILMMIIWESSVIIQTFEEHTSCESPESLSVSPLAASHFFSFRFCIWWFPDSDFDNLRADVCQAWHHGLVRPSERYLHHDMS